MKKKILAFVLVLCVLFCASALLIGAEEPEEAKVVAVVTKGGAMLSNDLTTLRDAVKLAAKNDGSTLKLKADITTDGLDISGTYTLDLNGYTLCVNDPLVISGDFVTITDSSKSGTGKLVGLDDAALQILSGNLLIRGGTIATDGGEFAIRHESLNTLYFAGKPTIEQPVFVQYAESIRGDDGADSYPQAFSGDKITLHCGWSATEGLIAVLEGTTEQFELVNTGAFATVEKDGNLITSRWGYFAWGVIALMFLAAIGLFLFAVHYTEKVKAKVQALNGLALPFVIPVFLPFMVYMTELQKLIMLVVALLFAGAVLYAAIAIPLAARDLKRAKAGIKKAPKKVAPQKQATTPAKEAPAEEVLAKETPAQEPAVEAPVEEAPAEEAPVEEATAEESLAEEAPAEEAPAEEALTKEDSVEETVEDEDEQADEASEAEAAPEEKAYAPLEANLPVVCEQTGRTLAYSTYRRSFLARIIAADEDVQARYDALKNALLSYKKVTARISWSYESIKLGRKQLAKFAICGKTLCLFLAIDPKTLGDSKYHVADMSGSKKYETVPCRLRLTSKRSIKWGLELIAKMVEAEQLEPNPKYKPTSYVPANEPDEILLEKGLIKKVR